MFSFFQKKQFLVDQLNGFVDIHNHILPGVDDGAKNVSDSISIIKGFSEFGVTNFICTPHIMHNYYDNTPKTIKKAYKKLMIEIDEGKLDFISLDFAAEHMIDDNFEDLLHDKQVLSLKKYHLLIEMSFLQAPINFTRAVKKVTSSGYFPILAHPERYAFLHGNFGRYHTYKKENILFQVNLLSLAGYYGADVKNIALKLIDKGLVDFLASDIHNIDQLNFVKECNLSRKVISKINPIIRNTIETFW